MYKYSRSTKPDFDMNYIVPGLALFSSSEFRLAEILSRFFEFCITWTERLSRRSTRVATRR